MCWVCGIYMYVGEFVMHVCDGEWMCGGGVVSGHGRLSTVDLLVLTS